MGVPRCRARLRAMVFRANMVVKLAGWDELRSGGKKMMRTELTHLMEIETDPAQAGSVSMLAPTSKVSRRLRIDRELVPGILRPKNSWVHPMHPLADYANTVLEEHADLSAVVHLDLLCSLVMRLPSCEVRLGLG